MSNLEHLRRILAANSERIPAATWEEAVRWCVDELDLARAERQTDDRIGAQLVAERDAARSWSRRWKRAVKSRPFGSTKRWMERMTRLTDDELRALGEAERETTPAPWDTYFETGIHPFLCTYTEDAEGRRSLTGNVLSERRTQNINFIALSRNAMPALLDEVRELRAKNAKAGDLRFLYDGLKIENGKLKAELHYHETSNVKAILAENRVLEVESVQLRRQIAELNTQVKRYEAALNEIEDWTPPQSAWCSGCYGDLNRIAHRALVEPEAPNAE